jgi:glycosyltransferase involved in cell wall biosynthesis
LSDRKVILHLSETSEPGGSETVLANIASNLDPDRYQSLVCLLREGWLTGHLKKLGVRYEIIENKYSYDPIFLAKLIRLIRRERVALIHAHEYMMNVYGSVAARLAGVPMIGTVHGKVYFTEKRSRTAAYRLAVALSSRIIAVSEDLKKYFLENTGIRNNKKILVLHNGIDVEKFAPRGTSSALRQQLGIPPDKVIVGTVGSLFKVKAFDHLILTAEAVYRSNRNFMLLIAGEGDEERYLRQLIGELNLQDTVKLLGFRDDIRELLNLFDIYVCSSISEGLSLSILEAMASGKPIVATHVGGNSELIADGSNGYLVPSGDQQALADKIQVLIKSKSDREVMGQRSRQIAKEKFSLGKMICDYQNLYEELTA